MEETITREFSEAAEQATLPVEDKPRLFDRAVAVILETNCIGTSRKVATGAIDTKGADPSLIKVSKTIMESKTLDKIRSKLGDIRRTVASRSTPSVMFRAGVYLLSIDLLAETDEYLLTSAEEIRALVVDLKREYTAIKKTAEAKLGEKMFNPADYPPEDSIDALIGISWAYIAVDAPKKLGEVSKAIMQREQEKAAATWASALDEATQVLRAGFKELVDHMVEKLQPGEDGKKRIFRDSMVGNIREFLRTFPSRNLGDDRELAALAAEAEQILSGVDAQSLRDGETIREKVAAGMATIKTRLDAAVCAQPTRKYSALTE